MREIRDSTIQYFINDKNRFQGEFKSCHDNGVMYRHCYYDDGKLHGESKSWDENAVLWEHRYYVNGVVVHDFLASPLTTDIEKMLLVLKYGAPLLDNSGHGGTIAQ